jgi:hypothetical protein
MYIVRAACRDSNLHNPGRFGSISPAAGSVTAPSLPRHRMPRQAWARTHYICDRSLICDADGDGS